MRTAILYVLLFIGSLFLFNTAQAYTSFYVSDAIDWTKQNFEKIPKDIVDICGKAGHEAMNAADQRDKGVSQKDAWHSFESDISAAEKRQNARLPQHIRLEFSRMYYTAYRHPEMTDKDLFDQFFSECVILGTYF